MRGGGGVLVVVVVIIPAGLRCDCGWDGVGNGVVVLVVDVNVGC